MSIVMSLLGFGLAGGAEHTIELAHSVARAEQFLVVAEALVLLLYIVLRSRAAEAGRLSAKSLANGRLRVVFWGGIVLMGLVFPVALETLYTVFPDYPGLIFVGGASLLIGGFFLRYAIVKGGIKDQHPLNKLVPAAYDWKTLAIASSHGANSQEVTVSKDR